LRETPGSVSILARVIKRKTKIKGVSVENTLDFAVFGDTLIWALTLLGLVPWEKVFARKKDFQEQLEEFEDGSGSVIHRVSDSGRLGSVNVFDVDNGVETYPLFEDSWKLETSIKTYDRGDKDAYGPWGVVPHRCPVRSVQKRL